MADPAVWITGTGPEKQLNFRLPTGGKGDKGDKGDKGADGANVLPTDTAIATAINASGSATKTALTATIATDVASPIADATGVYNLKPKHLRRARAALAKARAGAGFFRLATLGESTTAGTGTTNAAQQSWPAALRTMLATSGIPSAGTGIVPAGRGDALGTDPRWNLNGWTSRDGNTSNYVVRSTDDLQVASFQSVVSGTIARIYYQGNTHVFEWSVDGGAWETITPGGGNQLWFTEKTGLGNTAHSISFRRKTGSTGAAEVLGAEVRSGTSGVLLYNAGIAGNQILEASRTGVVNPAQTTTSSVFPADLVTLMYEINDAGAATPIDTFKTRWNQAIANVRVNGADVVIVASNPASVNLTAYTAALYEVAAANDVPLINIQDRWGAYATANTNGLMADTAHPNASGYADIARAVYNALAL